MNLENPEYFKMLTVTRSAVQKNIGKAYLSAIVLMLIKLAVNFLCSRPLGFAADSKIPGLSLILFYVLMLVILQFVSGLLTFGMIKHCTDMILNRAAYVKSVLFGFNRKDAWKISAFTTVLYFLAIALSLAVSIPLVMYIFKTYSLKLSSPHVFSFTVIGLSLILLIFNILINVPFMFAVNVSLESSSASLKEVLKKSFAFMKGRMIHFMGFALYSVGKNVVIIIGCIFVTLALPSLAGILEFLVILEIFTVVLKLYFSIPVYYYSLLAVNGMLKKHKEENSSESSLPADDGTDNENAGEDEDEAGTDDSDSGDSDSGDSDSGDSASEEN
ncbi:MAG: hypothetical protein K6D58_01425 [Treponema sp.]|nr:hypothetical protein [Treponema sp.]